MNYTLGRKYQNIGLLCKDIAAGKPIFFGKRIIIFASWAKNIPVRFLAMKLNKCYRAKKKGAKS